MARVSQAHLDARRKQILDASRRCFVRNGFHATSMQDILGEANLSSGALYRYFRSKDEIIIAIAQDVLASIGAAVVDALPADGALTPGEFLGCIFSTLEDVDSDLEIARMAVQVWSEAVRSPTVRGFVAVAFGEVIRTFADRIEIYQQQGSFPTTVEAVHLARALLAVMPGFMLQRALLGDADAGTLKETFTALLTPHHNA